MKSIESIDKTAKSIIAFDSINYGVYCKISSDELMAWFLSGEMIAHDPADATATPSPLAFLKTRLVSLYWASLPRLSWKRGH